MKILITGSQGQLGRSIRKISGNYPAIQFVFTDLEELDITRKKELNAFISSERFDSIINCTGYTAVDMAEKEPEKAKMLNGTAVRYLADAAAQNQMTLIHLSTDYVFDGKAHRPYLETDIPNPTSIYGKSKFTGEQHVMRHPQGMTLVRTAWLYSEFGNNFLKTIIRKANEMSELRVVADQVGTPTYAGDLARILIELAVRTSPGMKSDIFHYTNEGVASWYDFATEIIELSGSNCQVVPILTEGYPLPAQRPFYSLLDKSKIRRHLNIIIPHWKNGLRRCMANLHQVD